VPDAREKIHMTEASPYQTPSVDLQPESGADQRFILVAKPRSNPIGSGTDWISDGFGYYKRCWVAWIGAMLLGLAIMIVVSIIPFVNLLFEVLTYHVWIAGFALGCRAQSEGRSFKVSHLWAGFSNRVGALILLSLIYNVVIYAIFIVIFALIFSEVPTTEEAAELFLDPRAITGMVIAFALIIPVIMAALFAPHLIVFHELPLFAAIRLSFIGCIRNLLPFLLWFVCFLVLFLLLMVVVGLLSGILGLLAVIPVVLALLVLPPVSFASIYAAYEDIYLEN
jgi:hypothetical protein